MAAGVGDHGGGGDLRLSDHQHDRVRGDLPPVLLPALRVHHLHDAQLHPRRDRGLLPPAAAAQLQDGQSSRAFGKPRLS